MKRALTGAVLSVPVGGTVNVLLEKENMEKRDSVVCFYYHDIFLFAIFLFANEKSNTNMIIPRTSQVCVLLPWSRSVVHIAWRWSVAFLAGAAVVTKVSPLK